MDPLAGHVLEALYAVGIGLAVGLEREHSDLTHELEPTARPDGDERSREVGLGVRTFALISLVGWVLAVLGDANAMIQPLGLIAVAGLLAAQFVVAARQTGHIGATTEIAAIAVLVMGSLVHFDRRLAVVIALASLLLLVSKPWMRQQVVRLRRVEISATVQLAVLAAVLLPLLPSEPIDPWGAIPPRKVGLFVVLIGGVEYVGYVLTRLLGPERGPVLTGLVGGLTSSTAVTVSMARSAKGGQPVGPTQLATLLANVVMCVRVAIITAVLAPAVSLRLAVALSVMAAFLLGVAVVTWLSWRKARGPVTPPELKNPFSLIPAVTWGAALCAILVISKLATWYLGQKGFLLAAGASGLADVDAISLAAARGVTNATLSVEYAALAVVIATASNAVAKSALAISIGGAAFGRRIAFALLGSAAAAVITSLVGMALG